MEEVKQSDISLVDGTFAGITRRKRAGMSSRMYRSGWSLGGTVDAPGQHRMQSVSTAEFSRKPQVYEGVRRVNMNRSHKGAVVPTRRAALLPPSEQFRTTSDGTHGIGSAVGKSSGYVRQKPAFDRITACKTNYELSAPLTSAEQRDRMLPTTAKLHAHPAELAIMRPSVDTRISLASRTLREHMREATIDKRAASLWASQPAHAGAGRAGAAAAVSRTDLAHSRPRQDVESRVDLITGLHRPRGTYLRRREVARVRPSQNRAFATATQEAALDLVTGRVTRRKMPPPEAQGIPRGMAVDRPPLGTLSAVRPRTPKGTDYYAAFRQRTSKGR